MILKVLDDAFLKSPLASRKMALRVRSFFTRARTSEAALKERVRFRSPYDVIVHVGAHLGQEWQFYASLGPSCIVWIEADPGLFARLTQQPWNNNSPDDVRHVFIEACISSREGDQVQLKRFSNDGASNSLHSATPTFKAMWPNIFEVNDVAFLTTTTLDAVMRDLDVDVISESNKLLVLDVQGHEADVLSGTTLQLLRQFSTVLIEVSTVPVYLGGAKAMDIVSMMKSRGFQAVTPVPSFHGDMIFERN